MQDLTPCDDWSEKLAARHPEDLSASDHIKLKKHITECSSCASAYAAYNAMATRIAALPPVEPLPSLIPQLLRIQQDEEYTVASSYEPDMGDLRVGDSREKTDYADEREEERQNERGDRTAGGFSVSSMHQRQPTTYSLNEQVATSIPPIQAPKNSLGETISFTSLYLMVSPWLCLSGAIRERCRYLAAHLNLLTPECEDFLNHFIAQHVGDPKEQQYLCDHLKILRLARARGATQLAVHQTYVDLYSGLALEIPAWLEVVESRLNELSGMEQTERVTTQYKLLLGNAIIRAQGDERVAPESLAELMFLLAKVLEKDRHLNSRVSLQRAIRYYFVTLEIYRFDLYPLQHEKVEVCLSETSRNYHSRE